jgi:hypothetical protein
MHADAHCSSLVKELLKKYSKNTNTPKSKQNFFLTRRPPATAGKPDCNLDGPLVIHQLPL